MTVATTTRGAAAPVALRRRVGVGTVERALIANGASVKKGAWAEAFAQHAS